MKKILDIINGNNDNPLVIPRKSKVKAENKKNKAISKAVV